MNTGNLLLLFIVEYGVIEVDLRRLILRLTLRDCLCCVIVLTDALFAAVFCRAIQNDISQPSSWLQPSERTVSILKTIEHDNMIPWSTLSSPAICRCVWSLWTSSDSLLVIHSYQVTFGRPANAVWLRAIYRSLIGLSFVYSFLLLPLGVQDQGNNNMFVSPQQATCCCLSIVDDRLLVTTSEWTIVSYRTGDLPTVSQIACDSRPFRAIFRLGRPLSDRLLVISSPASEPTAALITY